MIDQKAPSPEQNPPTIHVEVSDKDLKQLDGLKPGGMVRVVITGEITSITMREASVDVLGSAGSLGVELKTLKITTLEDIFGALDDEDD